MRFQDMDSITKLKTMGRLAPVLARICDDEAFSEALNRAQPRFAEVKNGLQRWAVILSDIAPAILTGHAEDLIEIDMIMTGQTFEEVNAPGHNLLDDFQSFADSEFLDFFMRSGDSGAKKS